METTFAIITLLLAVWGVLEIILFFKIWRMTNDVHRLKDKLCKTMNFKDLKAEVNKLYILGNTEEAIFLVDENVVKDYIEIYNDVQELDTNVLLNIEGFNERKKLLINKYEKLYSLIGAEMPSKYKDLSYTDFDSFGKIK